MRAGTTPANQYPGPPPLGFRTQHPLHCGVCRVLICKVEEIHRTLKKHLAKEEEQLLPLLLQHFSFPEQAGLVAQFLYCIPLAMVEKVLAWLKPNIPEVRDQEWPYTELDTLAWQPCQRAKHLRMGQRAHTSTSAVAAR